MHWFAKAQTPQLDPPKGRGVERAYQAIRPTPKMLIVCLCLSVAIAVIMLFVPMFARNTDPYLLVAVCVIVAIFDAVLIVAMHLYQFLFRRSVDEVRIRERVITVRRQWAQRREFWLGDVIRMTWTLNEGRAQVHLFSPDGALDVPIGTLQRNDSVELIEWLRWGTPVSDENWPRFCHFVALPRRGPVERPLRTGEWRRTRRGFDRVMAIVAVALAAVAGIGVFWSDQLRWLTLLGMIPALWSWRFTIPKAGDILWRAPKMPHYYTFLAAIIALVAVCVVAVSSMHISDVAGFVFLAAIFGAITLAMLLQRRRKRFLAENEPRWIANSVAAWNAEAKSGAWALGRDRR